MNLYRELKRTLETYNLSTADIVAVIMWNTALKDNVLIPVGEFLDTARKVDYDAGYGSIEIDPSLKVIGEDWWLTREEYDGSEWFEFHTMPIWEGLSVTHISADNLLNN